MNPTPRSTPVVPAPRNPSTTLETKTRFPLKSPVVVVAAGNEWEHEKGSLTIGRDPHAGVVLDDPLISRMHARLLVQSDGIVVVEDLHSSNGVFVNGCKISRPSLALCEGDRMLLGTTEISVFSLRASATIPMERSKDTDAVPERATLPSLDALEISQGGAPQPRRRTAATTERNDTVDMMGQFAEKLMESGHPLEAVRTLSDHLQNLLKGATAGLTVPEHILESATHYSLLLHSWTQRDSWIEFVLELHLASQCVPTERSLAAIETARQTSRALDGALVQYLVKTIEGRSPPPSTDERLRLRRIARLGSEPDTPSSDPGGSTESPLRR